MKRILPWGFVLTVFLLAGCGQLTVLDPKGPVAAQQKDLILWAIGFMLFIVVVVFVLFTWIVVKYRDRPGHKDYNPKLEGSKWLEAVWTIIPVIIVIALAIPTVQTIYALEDPPAETAHKEPVVIHATSVSWKWIFSYPEQNIETVNYIVIPKERPIHFKLTSSDSMTSFWVPSLGGQIYAMAGMQTEIYLQADHVGTYEGRNSNFTGEGFAEHTFDVRAVEESDFEQWVEIIQTEAPKLTKQQYDDELMQVGHVEEMSFSSTHLEWVDHVLDPEYALRARGLLDDASEPHSESHSH